LRHTVYLFDGFQLDVTRHRLVSSGGLVQSLNSRAMDALLLLVANAGELVEKRRLMQTVWPNAIVEDNNLNQCVLAIRRALGESAGSNRYIMTVPGRGYRFVCPVREVAQESTADATTLATHRRCPPHLLLLGIIGMTCLLLLALLLLRMSPKSSPAPMAAELAPAMDQSPPSLVLRLRDPLVADGGPAPADPAVALARCMAAHPEMRLRVRVELVMDDGQKAWAASYAAGILDSGALNPNADGNAGCRDLFSSRQSPGN
jgi:DNA-binding winged helix-turn-helix (wHTH) protein